MDAHCKRRDAIALRVAELAINSASLTDMVAIERFKIQVGFMSGWKNQFYSLHEDIVEWVVDEEGRDVQEQLDIESQFLSSYFTIMTRYNLLLPDIPVEELGPVTPSARSTTSSRSNVQLRKIKLPVFSGDFKDWNSFIELYNKLIHCNSDLSSAEKFQYLKSSLNPIPLQVIKAFSLSADNYELAYAVLRRKYDNKRKLAMIYWEEIVTAKIDGSHNLQQVLDIYVENLAMLEMLDFKLDDFSDFIVLVSLLSKLDVPTREHFEAEVHGTDIPKFSKLKDVLEIRCASADLSNFNTKMSGPSNSSSQKREAMCATAQTALLCSVCKENAHRIYTCHTFLSKTAKERHALVKERKLCFNCLRNHSIKECKSKMGCSTCNNKHHSLLHLASNFVKSSPKTLDNPTNSLLVAKINKSDSGEVVSMAVNHVQPTHCMLLATALLEIQDVHGNFHEIRAILDTGSQSNFISNRCVKLLGLTRRHASITIHGIGAIEQQSSNGCTSCIVRSRVNPNFSLNIDTIILQKICHNNIPKPCLPEDSWKQFNRLNLADPDFFRPNPIDLLIGAELFPYILLSEKILGKAGDLSAINTQLGWILMGRCTNFGINPRVDCAFSGSSMNQTQSLVSCSAGSALDSIIKRFWEIEEISKESHYLKMTRNVKNCLWRLIRAMKMEGSFAVARKRLLYLEKRLSTDAKLKQAYTDFMRDYLDIGHMRLASPFVGNEVYYIPHHAVYNSGALKPKLRVVFDASAKDASGKSLNSIQFPGQKLQLDIAALLLNFRYHGIVFCTDIKQMYRQIMINPADRNFQRILWRFSVDDPIEEYVLHTVTYGVSSSPFLALRVILQLAIDEENKFPSASKVLKSSVYVDDILAGAETLEEALRIQSELIAIFATAGMALRKWSSNNPMLLSSFPPEYCEMSLPLDKTSFDVVKVLGLVSHPARDAFYFSVKPVQSACTKRAILSGLARIFDPLGFLSPIAFFAKHYMQLLWSLGLDWDASPPVELLTKWKQFSDELPLLSNIAIPWPLPVASASDVQIHGFCDASERGYAAVVYFRLHIGEEVSIRLVAAKSRVAPLKRISLPRLELSAAYVLSNLVAFVMSNYNGKVPTVYAWSESTITLTWIKSSPHRWQTFVSNRVSHIQDIIAPSLWHHVRSEHNPADCASRGLFPSQILNHSVWWSGPTWLQLPMASWPAEPPIKSPCTGMEERRVIAMTTVSGYHNSIREYVDNVSSFSMLQRVIAFALRFIRHCRNPIKRREVSSMSVSASELHDATLNIVKLIQSVAFSNEITRLRDSTSSSPPKALRGLNPFIDEMGMLRVGGRMRHAPLTRDQKFPLLLPKGHKFTRLLIQHAHHKFCHCGHNTAFHILSQQYWILAAKQSIRSVLRECMACFRTRPIAAQPMMGDLPKNRVNQIRAFTNIGIDIGGPLIARSSRLRNAKQVNVYFCVFVCMSTKAVHLELVADLSATAFLAALRRFIARRGRCARITSDCGTNFVGANRLILTHMRSAASTESIQWEFNPPAAPHFGGIWEAGIKSVKTHLKRVLGIQILTHDELNTLLIQIEAVLNSRPLQSFSSDPSDFAVLTPGHFLTLEPLEALPEPSLIEVPLSRLKRWQLVQRLHQEFWKRWSHEYLHTSSAVQVA